ncbi:protein phosphatase 1 regulatory subunit 3D-like isoform X1 [Gadus chalcogrammus]|uniref:protein phosphatase 1 regulatory subunit 3D-like isoform X1 n=3 Tax=Gadus chalcogrammus TaxID=1042646 RepID=UPI0024C480A4|nr:protein phosphatase 1 regulatory subunit 3D-like isoform X1 [Gadus chalcogrammus]XP_056462022.1 protein phosphatase 1 regulatory subunit 3D-like isoform X1 [Gadus chalcogrammus]XP_056462023.1 protein phosphatase 1 regulatory subunit 3D-like isoform X1 [Gadus chalcogrammus]
MNTGGSIRLGSREVMRSSVCPRGRQGDGMSSPREGPPWRAPHAATAAPNTKTVIRLRDIYDPQPPPAKAPVRIRPPGPPPPRGPGTSPPAGPPCSSPVSPPPKPAMRRRSRSLSAPAARGRGRAPRGPHVRFMDSMGLELEEVRLFRSSENPLIPPHVTVRLLMGSELASGRAPELALPYFKPCFCDNMAAGPGFGARLRGRGVSLGAVVCSDAGITGSVHVLNLAFEKEVTLAYSFTNWRSHTNTGALWVSSEVLKDGPEESETDVFHFWLPVPPFILQPGAVLEFAVCYKVNGRSYWDNNDGMNYRLSCHSYKLTVPKECEDSLLHFI